MSSYHCDASTAGRPLKQNLQCEEHISHRSCPYFLLAELQLDRYVSDLVFDDSIPAKPSVSSESPDSILRRIRTDEGMTHWDLLIARTPVFGEDSREMLPWQSRSVCCAACG